MRINSRRIVNGRATGPPPPPPPLQYVFVDYRVCTVADGADANQSEDPQEVVDRLLSVAHDVLDDMPEHCTGFTVKNTDADGGAGSRSVYQDPSHPFVQQLSALSGLPPEVVTFGTNATACELLHAATPRPPS